MLPTRNQLSFFSAANRTKKRGKVFASTQQFFPFAAKLEKEYSRALTNLGIQWEYEPNAFAVEIDGEIRHYVPDFYLPETDEWIEVTDCPNSKMKEKKLDAFCRDYPALRFREIFKPDIRELVNQFETRKALE